MTTTIILFVLTGALLTIVKGTVWDPCVDANHTSLTDMEHRSTRYRMSPGEVARCDRRLETGWYRVISRAGEDMPTKCPPEISCGTLYPIWMNGTIPPPDGKIHDRLGALNSHDDCFFLTYNIQVKNCGDYRVYNLQEVNACPAAYCFGEGSVCPPGQTSISGYTPCEEITVTGDQISEAADTSTEDSHVQTDADGNDVIPSTVTVTVTVASTSTSHVAHGILHFARQMPWQIFLAVAVIILFAMIAMTVILRFTLKRNRGSTSKVTPKDEPPAYCTLPPPVSIYYGDLYFPATETENVCKSEKPTVACDRSQVNQSQEMTGKC